MEIFFRKRVLVCSMEKFNNQKHFFFVYFAIHQLLNPVTARSKALVCGRSPAEIVGSSPTGGMDVCCDCCLLPGRGLCDELITRLEESYRLCFVVECDLETS